MSPVSQSTAKTAAKITKPKTQSKPKAKVPTPKFAKGEVIRTSHPTKHAEVGEAIVQADFYEGSTYIPVVFQDNELRISVHVKRVVTEQPAAA